MTPLRCMTASAPGCAGVEINWDEYRDILRTGAERAEALRKSRSPHGIARKLVGDLVAEPITCERFDELVRVVEAALLSGATPASALDAVRAELAGDADVRESEPDDDVLRDFLDGDER